MIYSSVYICIYESLLSLKLIFPVLSGFSKKLDVNTFYHFEGIFEEAMSICFILLRVIVGNSISAGDTAMQSGTRSGTRRPSIFRRCPLPAAQLDLTSFSIGTDAAQCDANATQFIVMQCSTVQRNAMQRKETQCDENASLSLLSGETSVRCVNDGPISRRPMEAKHFSS